MKQYKVWLEDYEVNEDSKQRLVAVSREAEGTHDGQVQPNQSGDQNSGNNPPPKPPRVPKEKKEKTEDQLARAVTRCHDFISFVWFHLAWFDGIHLFDLNMSLAWLVIK